MTQSDNTSQNKQDIWNTSIIKILIPMVVVLGIILIASYGYSTGKWLYSMFHSQ